MLTCPKCHAGVPEEMRFCLQCGASIAPTPPPAAPPVAADPLMSAAPVAPPAPYAAPAPPAPTSEPEHHLRRGSPTVPLKIAPTPVMSPRAEAASPGDETEEVDDETLKKSFARPVTQVGAVICRFCKGPLDLDGDFCEQCGAPVTEAAPPGTLKPKPKPAAPPVPPPATPAPPPSKPAQAAPPATAPVRSAPAQPPTAAPSYPAKPATRPAPTHPTPTRTPAPPTPPAEEPQSGLMGRLKGLFKKG